MRFESVEAKAWTEWRQAAVCGAAVVCIRSLKGSRTRESLPIFVCPRLTLVRYIRGVTCESAMTGEVDSSALTAIKRSDL